MTPFAACPILLRAVIDNGMMPFDAYTAAVMQCFSVGWRAAKNFPFLGDPPPNNGSLDQP